MVLTQKTARNKQGFNTKAKDCNEYYSDQLFFLSLLNEAKLDKLDSTRKRDFVLRYNLECSFYWLVMLFLVMILDRLEMGLNKYIYLRICKSCKINVSLRLKLNG